MRFCNDFRSIAEGNNARLKPQVCVCVCVCVCARVCVRLLLRVRVPG